MPDKHELIRQELAQILASERFRGADRHKQILEYVVEQYLKDRADDIRAKAIALDVYGYTVDDIERRETAIRVDVGRLRKRLGEYYAQEGNSSQVTISLPKGSYVPHFEFAGDTAIDAVTTNLSSESFTGTGNGTAQVPAWGRPPRSLRLFLAALIILVVGGALLFSHFQSNTPRFAGQTPTDQRRVAVFETSPKRLKAINLGDAGRDLIFPAVDPKRLQAALLVFQAAIETDPNYFGGHAGAAQILALSALQSPDNGRALDFLAMSEDRVKAAEALAPEAAWTHSARAAYEWAAGDYSSAISKSALAVSILPEDTHLWEFDALLNLFSGNFDHVIKKITSLKENSPNGRGGVFDNALGSAFFHSGDPSNALDVFQAAVAAGGPTGPITIAYVAASYQELGQTTSANRHAKQLMEGWPDFAPGSLFRKLFAEEQHADQLVTALMAAGWKPR